MIHFRHAQTHTHTPTHAPTCAPEQSAAETLSRFLYTTSTLEGRPVTAPCACCPSRASLFSRITRTLASCGVVVGINIRRGSERVHACARQRLKQAPCMHTQHPTQHPTNLVGAPQLARHQLRHAALVPHHHRQPPRLQRAGLLCACMGMLCCTCQSGASGPRRRSIHPPVHSNTPGQSRDSQHHGPRPRLRPPSTAPRPPRGRTRPSAPTPPPPPSGHEQE